MQVYTNRHLRDLLGRLCPAAVLWTEMEKTADLQTEDARHRRLWHRQTERELAADALEQKRAMRAASSSKVKQQQQQQPQPRHSWSSPYSHPRR